MPELSAGDTAWVLASSALVLLMTPGLALFYGGMVRAKSALNMLMMNFAAIAVVSVLWVLYGYSLAFSPDVGAGLLGGLGDMGLSGLLGEDALIGTLPATVFVAFQAMFAIITVALISGAIAERAKFSAWIAFVVVWATLVYFPVAHWVFFFDDGNGGWIADRLKALDFAGGTAVHINAGAAGLALALVLGRRVGWRKEPMRPHNLPLVLLGAGLLWFGWFGFNAGSAIAANNFAGVAFINTQVATAAALLGWILVERLRDGKPTTLGAASGAVAGLVAITPACASVTPVGAILLGLAAGVLCALAVGLKSRFGFDDSLDVVGVHLVGGLVGTLLIGLLASAAAPAAVDGLLYGGGVDQLWRQAVAAGAVMFYSFGLTYVIGKVIDKVVGFRVDPDDETMGIDLAEHAETAYDFSSIGGGSRPHVISRSGGAHTASAPARVETETGSPARSPNSHGPHSPVTEADAQADPPAAAGPEQSAESTEGSVAR
jgi:Amt family ammonium transporter